MSTEEKINEEIDEEGDASSVLDFRAAEWRNEAAKAYDRRDFGASMAASALAQAWAVQGSTRIQGEAFERMVALLSSLGPATNTAEEASQ